MPKKEKKEKAPQKKKSLPTNCAETNVRIRRKNWYYMNGKYFATKASAQIHFKKLEEKKQEELEAKKKEAEEAAQKEAEAKEAAAKEAESAPSTEDASQDSESKSS